MKLTHSFFNRKTQIVAKDLLGKHIVHKVNNSQIIVKIVETESYTQDDPACHASRGITPRNKVMFGPAGHIYVYFTYGNHWLLNFVTEKKGIPGAVLIRAVQPVKGLEAIRINRPKAIKDIDLTNGPGKLTQALGITKDFYGQSLTESNLYISKNGSQKIEIIETTRIGISQGCGLKYRYYIKDNPFISRK